MFGAWPYEGKFAQSESGIKGIEGSEKTVRKQTETSKARSSTTVPLTMIISVKGLLLLLISLSTVRAQVAEFSVECENDLKISDILGTGDSSVDYAGDIKG